MALNTLDGHEASIHEGEVSQVLSDQTLQDSSGLGALKSHQLMILDNSSSRHPLPCFGNPSNEHEYGPNPYRHIQRSRPHRENPDACK